VKAYKKFLRGAWDETPFREMSKAEPNAQTLCLALLLGSHTTSVPGVSRCGQGGLADTLDWTKADVQRVFAELEERAGARADWAARVVYVPLGLRHDHPENPNAPKAWRRAFNELPECAVKAVIDADMRAFLLQQDRERAAVVTKAGELIEHAWIRAWDPSYTPATDIHGTSIGRSTDVPETSTGPSANHHGTIPEPVTVTVAVTGACNRSLQPVAGTGSQQPEPEHEAGSREPAAVAFGSSGRAHRKVGGLGEGNQRSQPDAQPERKPAKCKCGSEVFVLSTGEPGEYFEPDGSRHVFTAACKRFPRAAAKALVAS
jgi:hypothetical protein